MLNKLTSIFNRYYIFISYLIIFVVNIPVLDNLPFSDDFRFIFSSNHVTTAPNPLVYFFPWSIYYKSWAFSYSILWCLFKVFGEQFVYYRFFNISIHFLNHLLFRKILIKKFQLSETKRNFISLLFLLHPISVLTTSWIFQIKTLLAVFFLLLLYINIESLKFNTKKDYIKLVTLFFFSLTSKVCAILFPIYLLVNLKKRIDRKKYLKITIPLIFISLFYGLLNIKGITHIAQENDYLKAGNSDMAQKTLVKNNRLDRNKVSYDESIKKIGGINFEINVYNDISTGVKSYISPFTNSNHFLSKYIIGIQNLGRLITYSLGINNFLPFYESNTQTATQGILFLFVILGSLFIVSLFYFKNDYFNIAFVLFLPISGLFYIPYMKYSYTSDHWFYPALIFFILGVIKSFKANTYLVLTLFIICSTNYLYTINKYETFPGLLTENEKQYESAVIVEHQAQYDLLENDWKKVFHHYTYLMDEVDFENPKYGHQIYSMGIKLRNGNEIAPYYPRMTKMILEKKDFQLLKTFNLLFSGILPNRTLDLTESLDAINSHRIDEHTYQKAIRYLK